ncbi:MAG: hypothetical protein KJZ65_15215 [Phycisphaerales bacterium]|nr:hypothetical protein [Phycisphaerales bacterium]
MGTVPVKINDKIAFFETHLPVWGANTAAIGLTAAQVTSLATLTAAARSAFTAAITARNAARAATSAQNDAVALMGEFGGDLVKTIRAFAETTNNPNVYNIAVIPPPAPPAPLGPPATPTNLTTTLNNAGQVQLSWGGTRAGGTSYLIERSVASSAGPWTLVGISEERKFTDQNVPSAVPSVSYRVSATRSGGTSNPTAPVTILFGTASGHGSAESGGSGSLSLAA